MRFRVDPGDISAEAAARRLGKSEADFHALLPKLFARGFPRPDPDTGNFDLQAIDEWRKRRHPHLFGTPAMPGARDAGTVVSERLARMRDG